MSIITRTLRYDDKMHASGTILLDHACGLRHFPSDTVLNRDQRKRRKVKSSLTLDEYMTLSGKCVNPDWQFRTALRVSVGQISQQIRRLAQNPAAELPSSRGAARAVAIERSSNR